MLYLVLIPQIQLHVLKDIIYKDYFVSQHQLDKIVLPALFQQLVMMDTVFLIFNVCCVIKGVKNVVHFSLQLNVRQDIN